MLSLAELDRENVVEFDFRSAEFRANAHRHVAAWPRGRGGGRSTFSATARRR